MDALMADLEAIPQPPPPLRCGDAAQGPRRHLDLRPRPAARGGEPRLRLSGASSRTTCFEGADGERIARHASALQEDGRRPGLIVVHGLFSSRRFDYVRQIAVRAFYEWGFNVAALDLRSFGLTNLTSEAPTSGGWKEGEDMIAAGALSEGARGDQRRRARNLARRLLGARRLPPGGRARSAGRRHPRRLAARRPEGDGEAPLRAPAAHASRPTRSTAASGRCSCRASARRGWEGIEDFVRPGRAGLGAATTASTPRRSGAGPPRSEHIAAAQVPVLVLHPEDDDVIPVRARAHARRGGRRTTTWFASGSCPAAATARSMPSTATGSTRSYRGFFERWAGYEGRDERRRRARGPVAVQADLLRREVTDSGERHRQKTALDRPCGRAPGRSPRVAANRVAAVIWARVFEEEPPE